jgi:hypothetical protein
VDVYLCPDCQTDAEARAHAQAFVEMVERGKRRKGESYPEYLAALGEGQRRWLAWRRRENAELEQGLGEKPDDES